MKSQILEVVLQSKTFSDDPDRRYIHKFTITSLDIALMKIIVLWLVAVIVTYLVWEVGKFGWLIF